MRTACFAAAAMVAFVPQARAAEGWALSDEGVATRMVTVELSKSGMPIAEWRLPVAKDAAEVPERIFTRELRIPRARTRGSFQVLSDTWLGDVDAESAWVRFSWWLGPDRGAYRLANDLVWVSYGEAKTWPVGGGLAMHVRYTALK